VKVAEEYCTTVGAVYQAVNESTGRAATKAAQTGVVVQTPLI